MTQNDKGKEGHYNVCALCLQIFMSEATEHILKHS